MRIDLASIIKIGDIVYNCFMDELVVTSVFINVTNNSIVFGTIDTRLNRVSYDSKDVYHENLEDESDDEKSWIEWAKNNRDFFVEFDNIETMKEIYKIGFCNGFEHKQKVKFEEIMQK